MSNWEIYNNLVSVDDIKEVMSNLDFIDKLVDGEYEGELTKIEAVELGQNALPAVKFYFKLDDPKGIWSTAFFLIKNDGSFNPISMSNACKHIKKVTSQEIKYNNLLEFKEFVNNINIEHKNVKLRLTTPIGSSFQSMDMQVIIDDFSNPDENALGVDSPF